MLVVTALMIVVTAVALTGQAGVELTRDGGGVARSAALGLVLVAVGLLAARYGSREASTSAAVASACSTAMR